MMTMAQEMAEAKRDLDRQYAAATKAAGIKPNDPAITVEQLAAAFVAAGLDPAPAAYYLRELTAGLRAAKAGRPLVGFQEPDEDLRPTYRPRRYRRR